jgi:hypothetical protein
MNIIFGESRAILPDHYTVLELDTFRVPGRSDTVTAYCVIEKIAMHEFATVEDYKSVHADLIKNYKLRQWSFCEQAVDTLMGRWAGELDSFYQDLLIRVLDYKQNEPPAEWDGIRLKQDS